MMMLGLGRLPGAEPDGDPRDSVGHDLDLARIESRLNQPALRALKRFQVGELMSQIPHV